MVMRRKAADGVRRAISFLLFLALLWGDLSAWNWLRGNWNKPTSGGMPPVVDGPGSIVTEPTPDPEPPQDPLEQRLNELVAPMSLRDKVCQLVMVTPETLGGSGALTQAGDSLAQGLADYPVGGVVLFAQNIVDREQVQQLIAGAQERSALGLFVAVDEEGGEVARVAHNSNMGTTVFPDMAQIGGTGDPEQARNVGRTIGGELMALGFNLDFAPVADVNYQNQSKVIARRAFSAEPMQAADMVAACVEGFAESGILCTLKHFPGHGSTTTDTHSATAICAKTREELEACDLIPFRRGISAGAPLVMVAHVTYPALDETNPASLSRAILSGILREEMGYNGLIVTDALNMGAALAAEKGEGASCAALQALRAGSDLLLMPGNLAQAVEEITTAAEQDEALQAQIEASVRRILRVKLEKGIVV